MPFSVNIHSDNQKNNRNITAKNMTIPSRYSLKDNIQLVVRDQKLTGECWAFSTTNILSTNLETTNKTNLFTMFSVRHMDYATSKTFSDGINLHGYNREVGTGGNVF